MLSRMGPPGRQPEPASTATAGEGRPALAVIPGGHRLGERLVDAKVVKKASVQKALAEQLHQVRDRRPRSTMTTTSPAWTTSMRALRPFLAS